MSRAYGARTTLRGCFETTYGTAPSDGYLQFPYVSSGLGERKGLVASDLIGVGRDPAQPLRDAAVIDGDLVVPLDTVAIGHWLKLLLGAPTTTGAGPYTHTFKSGGWSLPSMTLEMGIPDVPDFRRHSGLRADRLALQMRRGGLVNVTLGLVAASEAQATSSIDTTPTVITPTRFESFQGKVRKDGTDLGNMVSMDLTYANNLTRIEGLPDDLEGLDPSQSAASGTLVMRHADTTLMDLATAGSSLALKGVYTIDADTSLAITFPEVRLDKPSVPVNGPGGIQVTYNWMASYNAVATCMMSAVLVNSTASYA